MNDAIAANPDSPRQPVRTRGIPSRRMMLAIAATWALAVFGAMAYMARHQFTPGTVADAPLRWPAETRLHHRGNTPTILVFIHPRCPCSNATISRLEQILDSNPDATATLVVITHGNLAPDWLDSPAIRRARDIAELSVVIDATGDEARRFGASTSGQVLVYGVSGSLLFHGGLTAGRGQDVDGPGAAAVSAILRGSRVSDCQAPVYGCPIFNDTRTAKAECATEECGR